MNKGKNVAELSKVSRLKKFFPLEISILILILLAGAYFRFNGLRWDNQTHLHPDERFLSMVLASITDPIKSTWSEYFDAPRSSLNPNNRGSAFFVYGTFPVFLVRFLAPRLNMFDYENAYILGRILSAGMDLATVLLVYLIAVRFYNRKIGLLAAAFYAFTVLGIQLSHYYAVDTFANFFVFLAIYFAVRNGGMPTLWSTVGFAVATGLAMSSKISALPVILVFPAAILINRNFKWKPIVLRLLLMFFVVFVVFRMTQPYAFKGPGFWGLSLNPGWVDNMKSQTKLAQPSFYYPPSVQWNDRSFSYSPMNMILWGLGVPLGVLAWTGFLWMAWRIFKDKEWPGHLLLWGWTAAYFVWQLFQPNMMLRYQFHIYPALAIIAAWFIFQFERKKTAMYLLGGIVLGATFLWAFAFTRVYSRPLTRITASRWMFENIPIGSKIAQETSWDDTLPLRIDNKDPYGGMYTMLNFEMYWQDDSSKLTKMTSILDQADYISISSGRQWGSVGRLWWHYPLAATFYQHLLGCPDNKDIPKYYVMAGKDTFKGDLGFDLVAIFDSNPNIGPLVVNDKSAEESFHVYDHPKVFIFKKRADYNAAKVRQILGSVDLTRIYTQPKDLLLPADRFKAQAAGGTWSQIFKIHNSVLATILWYLALGVLGLVTYPILRRLLPGLGEYSYALSRAGGLLLLAYPIWLGGSVGIPFNRLTIFFVILLLALISWQLLKKEGLKYPISRKFLITTEAIFLAFFVFDLVIRLCNPDLWHSARGGEKPMDFSFFNAIIKSSTFPPYDPWYGGGYINYYYFGFVFVGVLVKFLGIVPSVAYNLVVPTLFAMTALGAFCAASVLSDRESYRGRLFVGLTAAVAMVLLGNLGTVHMFLTKASDQWRIAEWYWFPSRIIPAAPGEISPITEFPLFTFLFADLHAHMISMPIALLALAWSLSVAKMKERPSWMILLFGGLIIGALRLINTWDFPLYLFLGAAAVFYAVRYWLHKAPFSCLLVGLCLVMYRPFDWWFGLGFNDVSRWTGSRSPVLSYLTHWGFFYGVLILALIVNIRSKWTTSKKIVFVLTGVGLLITLAVEFIVLANDLGRMNTVFKFYLQAWTLFSVCAAVGAGWLVHRSKWLIIPVIVFGCAAALYPIKAIPDRIHDRMTPNVPLTLDGMEYMKHVPNYWEKDRMMNLFYDYEAIRWMQDNVKGSPIIVEGCSFREYLWGNRFTIYTGLPGVVGWSWHVRAQRMVNPGNWVDDRINEVNNFYKDVGMIGPKNFLKKYNVRYVIVGQLERAYYPGAGLDKFTLANGFKSVYSKNDTTVYEVVQ